MAASLLLTFAAEDSGYCRRFLKQRTGRSREHAKESANGKVTGSIGAWCLRFSPERSLSAQETPASSANEALAYILLICVRNKNAALPCDPSRIRRDAGLQGSSEPICGVTQSCDDPRVNEFIVLCTSF